MNSDNPIAERLEILQTQWDDFATAPGARVFRWLFLPDEQDMLQAFVDSENADAGVTNDVFVRLCDPFANAMVHGTALAASFDAVFRDAAQPEGDPGSFPPPWHGPAPSASEAGDPYLLRCLQSFCDHYQGHMGLLVLILTPASISVPKVYHRWLADLAQANLPAQVRLLVPDHPSVPVHAALDSLAPPGTVVVKSANLDMPGAIRDIAEGSCDEDDPASVFRKHYALMTTEVGAGNMTGAKVQADQALAITAAEDLPQLEPAIHLTMAAGHLGAKDYPTALERYRASQASSRRAMTKDDPGGAKLLVQSLFGECSVFLLVKDYASATPGYREAASVATVDKDPRTALEAHRMAAWCLSREGRWDDAHQEGVRALELGESLPPSELAQTGMRFAARDLCKVVRKWRFDSAVRDGIEARLATLLGPDWEAELDAELGA